MAAEVFAGGWVDDLDGVGVDEDKGWGAGVCGADAEVVHAAGSAQGDLAVAVDGVGRDAVGPQAGFWLAGGLALMVAA